MVRYCYDSTTPTAIPADAQMVAGYVDGAYQWSSADWARFPEAVKVHIVVNPATNSGHVLDVEPGNWDAAASVDWVLMRRASGLATPTVYAGSWAPGYTWQDVLNAHAARGVDPPLIWYANYSTGPYIPAGAIAHQYTDTGPYDLSVVADYWPGVDPAPAPDPPTPTPEPTPGPDVPDAQAELNLLDQDIDIFAAAAHARIQGAREDMNS